MSLCASCVAWWCNAEHALRVLHQRATAGTHRWEGTSEVVGVVVALKAAVVGELGKRQGGDQAHQVVVGQAPAAAGVREGWWCKGGAGGRWLAVSVGAAPGLAGHTAHHPPTPSSYRVVSFVIADRVAGIVSTMLKPFKSLQCTAPSPTASPPAAEACPRTDRHETGDIVWRVSVWRE